MILYSVIIPFRDCFDLLQNACNSIPKRDDIQVILVDNSIEPIGDKIVHDLINRDIIYLTSSPVKGAGCARNAGMSIAKGKYLLFLDADDYFTDDAFDVFDKEVHRDFDIIYFNADSIKIPSGLRSTRHSSIDKIIKSYINTGKEDYLRYRFVNPVCKLIKKELIDRNHIQFQEVPAGNDQMFSTWTGHYAKRIKAVDKPVYMITEGEPNSSLTKTKSKINQFSRFKVAVDHYKFMKSINRIDLAFRIPSFIYNAFKLFGFKEGCSYFIYAIKNRVNLFKLLFVKSL